MSLFSGWGGSWHSLESVVSLNLSSMSVLMALLVGLGESIISLTKLSWGICVCAILFFGATSVLPLFLLFELVMVLVFVMLLLCGSQPEKVGASYYALVYTGAFSLPFLGAIFQMGAWPLHYHSSPLMAGVSLGLFMVKCPLYSLHSWLPKAHVEAPTTASMLLAGLLLKVGVYGAMKMMTLISTPLHLISILSAIGLCVGALLASTSSESKVLAAYSSICHINLGVYGLNVGSMHLMSGNHLLCMSHGYTSLLMFYVVGEMYFRTGSRVLYYMVGLLAFSTSLATLMVGIFLSNAGVPPTLSFWSELLLVSYVSAYMVGLMCMMFTYFMVSFYYSMSTMIHINKVGGVVSLPQSTLLSCMWGLLMLLNICVLIN